MTAPCYGQHVLFDSVDRDAHRVAKELCDTCPIRDTLCLNLLLHTERPQGTWAGKLVDPTGTLTGADVALDATHDRSKTRMGAEEDAYSDEEAYEAGKAHRRGERSPWAIAGNRVWVRRRYHARVRAKAAAAAEAVA